MSPRWISATAASSTIPARRAGQLSASGVVAVRPLVAARSIVMFMIGPLEQ